VAAEIAATVARVARLTMAELAAARAKVEAAAADAARAVAAELEALHTSSIDSSVSTDDDIDNELKLAREAAREQATQWASAHPRSVVAAAQTGAHGGRAPDGSGSPDMRGHAGGWVDGDRGLYRRHDSPSLDRYHGHHGI
jgi:hypothetical protein